MSLPDDARLLIRAERVNQDELVQIDQADRGPADVGLRDFLHFRQVTSSVRVVAAELHKALQAARPDVLILPVSREGTHLAGGNALAQHA